MNFKLFFILFAAAGLSLSFISPPKKLNCDILKDCKLKFLELSDTTGYVKIKGNKHIEYSTSNNFFIKSDLDWVGSCEYNATITEVTIPGFPYQKGAVMNVKFTKIENGIVLYTAKVEGKQFKGKFKIINP